MVSVLVRVLVPGASEKSVVGSNNSRTQVYTNPYMPSHWTMKEQFSHVVQQCVGSRSFTLLTPLLISKPTFMQLCAVTTNRQRFLLTLVGSDPHSDWTRFFLPLAPPTPIPSLTLVPPSRGTGSKTEAAAAVRASHLFIKNLPMI